MPTLAGTSARKVQNTLMRLFPDRLRSPHSPVAGAKRVSGRARRKRTVFYDRLETTTMGLPPLSEAHPISRGRERDPTSMGEVCVGGGLVMAIFGE